MDSLALGYYRPPRWGLIWRLRRMVFKFTMASASDVLKKVVDNFPLIYQFIRIR
jgi:hypothetical protein